MCDTGSQPVEWHGRAFPYLLHHPGALKTENYGTASEFLTPLLPSALFYVYCEHELTVCFRGNLLQGLADSLAPTPTPPPPPPLGAPTALGSGTALRPEATSTNPGM